mmetsp:Transcript_3095/g.13849  ORF Transcript_3095/g.13849 Transcript_3095/m.13849 type:complete len:221 (-) Transcript_3095:140-802(-)
MSYSTIDKEAQPLVAEEASYTKKVLAGAVAIAFVLGAAAATATSSVGTGSMTYLAPGGAKNGWKDGVFQTYAFAVYDSDETWSKCQSICKASIIGSDGGRSVGDKMQMPCLTSYDMVKQMAGDMVRMGGGKEGSTSWFDYKDGKWICEHKSYNTKLGFYYDYAHWDPKADPSANGCGVVQLGAFSRLTDYTDNHWHIKSCDTKHMCTCQGSSFPEWVVPK